MREGLCGAVVFWVMVGCGGRSTQVGIAGAPNEQEHPGNAHAGSTASSVGGADNGGFASAQGGALAVGGRAESELGGAAGFETESAGATSDAGAAGSAEARCTPGRVRCQSFRERCDDKGAWQKEDFVCAIDITGAEEQPIACAVKSDGRMNCFGPPFNQFTDEAMAKAPKRSWAKLILADDPLQATPHQLCGIDIHGAGVCWGLNGESGSLGGPLKQIAVGEFGPCAVPVNGAGYCRLERALIGPTPPLAGPFQDLLIRNDWIFGLQQDGAVSVPYPEFSLPSAQYTQLSASDLELCAVRADRTLACAPRALPPALAGQHFIQVAVEYYGGMCAIRENGSILCDPLDKGHLFTPPMGEFTRIAAISGGMCAIRNDGSVSCFGERSIEPPADW